MFLIDRWRDTKFVFSSENAVIFPGAEILSWLADRVDCIFFFFFCRGTLSSRLPQRFKENALRSFQVAAHHLPQPADCDAGRQSAPRFSLRLHPAPSVTFWDYSPNSVLYLRRQSHPLVVSKHFLRHFHPFRTWNHKDKIDSSTRTRTRGLIVRLLLFSFHTASRRWPFRLWEPWSETCRTSSRKKQNQVEAAAAQLFSPGKKDLG